MENTPPIKVTLSIPAELFEALDQERMRLAAELRTRLSVNQMATRLLRLGLERP